jgi:hypothetical protein
MCKVCQAVNSPKKRLTLVVAEYILSGLKKSDVKKFRHQLLEQIVAETQLLNTPVLIDPKYVV